MSLRSTHAKGNFSTLHENGGFFIGRPAGRTCLTVIMNEVNESLLLAGQGEELAEGQLRHREVIVGRKPKGGASWVNGRADGSKFS